MTAENLALRQQLASSDGRGINAASICGVNTPTYGFSIPNRAEEGTCQVNGRGLDFKSANYGAGMKVVTDSIKTAYEFCIDFWDADSIPAASTNSYSTDP